MTNTFLPYALAETYCILYAITILGKLNSSIGTQHEVFELRNMILSYLALLATDILWALNQDSIIVLPRTLNAVLNAISVMAVTLGCYFWYRYIEARLKPAYSRWHLLRVAIIVLLAATLAADVLSVFTGWFFYIDAANHYCTTPLFDLQGVVNYIFLVIPTITAVQAAIRTRMHAQRVEYLTYSVYMLAPLAAGFLEDRLETVPVLALNIFMVIQLLFVTIQNMQVHSDALTGLNNRGRLSQYLEDHLAHCSASHPLTVMMMDINGFKAINDSYGHVRGDQALKDFAAVIKDVAERYHAFAARYGGDEFCIVGSFEGRDMAAVDADIRQTLARRQAGADVVLTVSIGCVSCTMPSAEATAVINQADQMLYQDKQRWHGAAAGRDTSRG